MVRDMYDEGRTPAACLPSGVGGGGVGYSPAVGECLTGLQQPADGTGALGEVFLGMRAAHLASIALVVGGSATAQTRDTVRVAVGHGSEVWIEGSSNVAGWRCRATNFDARVELARGATPDDLGAALRTINVKVAVRDLKCGNGKMDHDLYAALKANDPANPAFILGRFDVVADSAGRDIATRGPLKVAGVERTVEVPVTTDRVDGDAVRARGAVVMKMTDFGIKPPTGLFGLIRSRNEITVRFDLVVSSQTIVALR